MCTVVFVKESDTSLRRSQAKLILNDPKQLNRAKQKHGVDMTNTKICVTFDMSFAKPQSNSSALLPLKNNLFRNNSVKQNRLEVQN